MKRAPDHLSKDAGDIWRGLMDEFDLDDTAAQKILSVALEAYDRAQAARIAINRDGMVVRDKFDQIKPHPLLANERDSRAAFLAGLKALNLDLLPLENSPGRPAGGR
ncbi:MAG: hypothetical protein R6W72_07725 [Desulfurivibrionaceae bacterium]